MAFNTLAQAISQATGGFRLNTPTAAARRAVTQNILTSVVAAGVGLGGVSAAEALFRRAGLGIRGSDFSKLYRSTVGNELLTASQRGVLDRQRLVPLDRIPNLRDIPTVRVNGVSQFIVRAQVEVIDSQTGVASHVWVTINSDFRLTAQEIKAAVPDFGFSSGSESLLQQGDIVEINTFKRSETTLSPT